MSTLHSGCTRCGAPIIINACKPINATGVNCGAKIRLVVNCPTCGCVKELTDKINQASYQQIEDLLKCGVE